MIRKWQTIEIVNVPLVHKDFMPIIRTLADAWDLKSNWVYKQAMFYVSKRANLSGYTTIKTVSTNVTRFNKIRRFIQ